MSTLTWRRHTWRMYRHKEDPSPFTRMADVAVLTKGTA